MMEISLRRESMCFFFVIEFGRGGEGTVFPKH